MKNTFWPSWSENKIFTILLACLLIVLIVFVGFGVRSKIKAYDYIGISPEMKNTITVSGEGKVIAIPDVAKVTLGTEALEKTVAAAQTKVTKDINSLISELKSKYNVDKKDIKTVNYSIYPEYDWRSGSQVFKGYKVSQNVEVTIRDTEKAGDVIGLAGDLGLTSVGGLQFTIDDPEIYKQEAREKALEQAKQKAEALADIAGVKLGKVVSFSENEGYTPDYYMKTYAEDAGIGGAAAPTVEVGSQEVIIDANVEYEIL
ncbi:MAG TPA: SIMPL domain-containing protein [Candidatus Bipolaricaulota bacterium]|nr:SIMPL domain-containing protein [Candidatus Bipolaricaulota bacterium]